MRYGEVLKEYLDEKDITVKQVAASVGCPKSAIYALIAGDAKEPTLGRAKAICDALGVTLQDFADRMDGK